MTDRTEAMFLISMENLIAQDADLIDVCTKMVVEVTEALARYRLAERANIVAWLHEQHDIYNPSDNWSAYWAERIEAGEHLK